VKREPEQAKPETATAGSDGKRDRQISDREVSSVLRALTNGARDESLATCGKAAGEGCVSER
jgi:hypothetical protein